MKHKKNACTKTTDPSKLFLSLMNLVRAQWLPGASGLEQVRLSALPHLLIFLSIAIHLWYGLMRFAFTMQGANL